MNLHTWLLHVEYRRILRTVCVILFVYSAPYFIYAQKKLSASEAITCGERIVEEWKDSVRRAMSDVMESKRLTIGENTMLLDWKFFGEKPVGGRALFISLHGGGGVEPEVNDQQWRNQMRLYSPKDAVYLCPRAPFNTWDLHFHTESDDFYRQIVAMAVSCMDVDPDKVYLMGYSAGGDGVWRLAPRLADMWAAASMMAGHPGDVRLENLLNLPYMIWCGEYDSAYNRNRLCRERIEQMDSLHRDDPSGYIFEGHIIDGKGHWMDRVDTAAVEWMEQYKRNPYPRKIVWRQEAVAKPYFYWLSAPVSESEKGREVRASIDGNNIVINKCDYSEITILLNDKMVDLDKRVKVIYQGKTLFRGRLKRKASILRSTLFERNDPSYMFPAQVKVKVRR